MFHPLIVTLRFSVLESTLFTIISTLLLSATKPKALASLTIDSSRGLSASNEIRFTIADIYHQVKVGFLV